MIAGLNVIFATIAVVGLVTMGATYLIFEDVSNDDSWMIGAIVALIGWVGVVLTQ